ncbi:hypothetical protein Gpo141_00007676 [Globisporangium polare]
MSASSSPPRSASDDESAAATNSDVPPELRCTYRSKPCFKRRAVKANGEHHKLCDLHRYRANVNQQRVHLRRRLSKRQLEQLDQKYGPLPPSSNDGDDDSNQVQIEPSAAPCGDLSIHELHILKLLLSDRPEDKERIQSFSDNQRIV